MIAHDAAMVLALVLPAALFLTLVFLAQQSRTKSRSGEAVPAAASERETASAGSHSAPMEPPGVTTLLSRIAQAETLSVPSSLAPLHLALARAHMAAGRDAEALVALRSAAGLAALHGPRPVHAEARIELADAAYRTGDLISACEHWQLARTAYQDEGQADNAIRIEKRMRENGCPTDWVLTDF